MQEEIHYVDGAENTMFTLCTVNNLGLIHNQLNNDVAAKTYFRHLLSSLMCLFACTNGVRREEYAGFLHNITTIVYTETQAAAAA